LPAINGAGLTVKHDDEEYLVEKRGELAGTAVHLQIARDMDEVPAARSGSTTGPIVMAPGQVPASVTHLTLLPSGLIALVRGVTSPGPHQSAAILRKLTGIPFFLEPLVRGDQVQVLNNAVSASTVEFSATVVDPAVAAGDPLLTAARDLVGMQDYEVTVKVVARKTAAKGSLRAFARKLIVEQENERIELRRGVASLSRHNEIPARVVDLLDDQIVEKRIIQVPTTDGQPFATLGAAEVLSAVQQAYNDLTIVIGAALAETPSDFPG
jgi:hypothetical protein